MVDSKIMDKLYGGFSGLCLGNALGLPHEYKYGTSINEYTGILQFPIQHQIRYYPVKYGVIGQISDDVTMVIATMRILCKYNNHTDIVENELIRSYIEWANSSDFNTDKYTNKLFKDIKTIAGYKSRKNRINNTESNNSLVRAFSYLLCRWYFPGTYKNISILCTKLTHDTLINTEATRIYLEIVEGLLVNKKIDDILITLSSEDQQINTMLSQVVNSQQRNLHFTHPEWVANTLYISIYMLKKANIGTFTFSQMIVTKLTLEQR